MRRITQKKHNRNVVRRQCAHGSHFYETRGLVSGLRPSSGWRFLGCSVPDSRVGRPLTAICCQIRGPIPRLGSWNRLWEYRNYSSM